MKIDVNVGKKFTLNTGNYSSISPSVSITAHDIDVKDTDRVSTLLTDIADVLLHEQIETDAKTMASIKKMGFGEYFKKLDREKMESSLENAIDELSGNNDDIPF
jgi:predicted sugar kinase